MAITISKIIEGHTICALGDAAAWPVQGLVKNFRWGRLRARGQLPPIDSPHRKPQHREGLTIPEGSLQRTI